jgi:glycosyltransferase involved in cell wall biosynthesis
MTSDFPRVSVIIPAFNSARTLGYCLTALQRQTLPAVCFDVIVVDDGSLDDTKDVALLFPEVQFISINHQGPAAARNFGVTNSSAEIVLFTDADCIPAEDWVENMIAPFDEEDVVGVKGIYLNQQRELIARFVQAEYESKYGHMQKEKYIDFIDTYSAGYRRDVFLQYGGFDTDFPTSCVEDQEFSFRIARAGHKMVFAPGAKVLHLRHARSLKEYFLKKFKIGYWKVLVHKRYPDKLIHDSHTPSHLKLQILIIGGAAFFTLLGFVSPLNFWISGFLCVFFLATALPLISQTWRKDIWVAIISPGLLLVRTLALGLGFSIGTLNLLRNSFEIITHKQPTNIHK